MSQVTRDDWDEWTVPCGDNLIRAQVMCAIVDERARQDQLKAEGRFKYTCADLAKDDPDRCLAILTEELGEVARAVCEHTNAYDRGDLELMVGCSWDLRAELIQVAAVCLAWVEGLDS